MRNRNIKWNQTAEVGISCGMIRMSLRRELDWQILEAQKLGRSKAARVSAFAKAAL